MYGIEATLPKAMDRLRLKLSAKNANDFMQEIFGNNFEQIA